MNQKSYILELQRLVDSLPPELRKPFLQTYSGRIKDPALALALSGCLGIFGADRFYAGHLKTAIVKLITLGGLGLLSLIDLLSIGGEVRDANMKIARELKSTFMSNPRPLA